LKQSPREWYVKLSSYLNLCNFKVSNVDHSLFTKIEGNNITIILVYIDDIIITGNNQVGIKRIKRKF
jgi:Reverse transcriptase (RNA-dependent DNA polymerase)